MSESEPETEVDAPETTDETEAEIDDDDIVDVASIAEEVEEETALEDDTDDEITESSDSSDSTEIETGDRVTPGEIYCNGLGVAAAAGRQRFGNLDKDVSAATDEYAGLASDLDVDTYVDQWMQEQGGVDELSPGQAALVSTLMMLAMVAVDDPEMATGLADGLGGEA